MVCRLCLLWSGSDWALLILEHPEEGGSVLTKEAMDIFWELDENIGEVEVSFARP